jgi:hypothetical protein
MSRRKTMITLIHGIGTGRGVQTKPRPTLFEKIRPDGTAVPPRGASRFTLHPPPDRALHVLHSIGAGTERWQFSIRSALP